jgi:hypothetical protein
MPSLTEYSGLQRGTGDSMSDIVVVRSIREGMI